MGEDEYLSECLGVGNELEFFDQSLQVALIWVPLDCFLCFLQKSMNAAVRLTFGTELMKDVIKSIMVWGLFCSVTQRKVANRAEGSDPTN